MQYASNRWTVTIDLALALYGRSLSFRTTALDARTAMETRVIAHLLAAAWIAVEQGAQPPWASRPRRMTWPPVTRDMFLGWTREIWDRWQETRRARLLVIDGGKSR
jgi:hypothetical protein